MVKRRKITKLPNEVTLPPEVCSEILSRLPAKPLVRFRCVSKRWCSLIDDPYFVSTHLINHHNNQEKPRLLVLEPPDMFDSKQLCSIRRANTFRKTSSHGLEISWYQRFQVAGYINGITCMKKYKLETQLCNLFLWNPSIDKTLELPLPYVANIGIKPEIDFIFGFDPIRNDYKVIATIYGEGGIHLSQFSELYSLCKQYWKGINIVQGPCAWSNVGPKAFLNGVTYWVGVDLKKATPKGKYTHFVTFDVSNETFDYIELPDCEDLTMDNQRFPTTLRQSIVLMDIYEAHYSYIWAMEEVGATKSWTKLYSISLPLYHKVLYLRSNGMLLFGGEREGVTSYNIETQEVKMLAKSYKLTPVFTGEYMESLALLNENVKKPRINHPAVGRLIIYPRTFSNPSI